MNMIKKLLTNVKKKKKTRPKSIKTFGKQPLSMHNQILE